MEFVGFMLLVLASGLWESSRELDRQTKVLGEILNENALRHAAKLCGAVESSF
jgi:hypothetical protein